MDVSEFVVQFRYEVCGTIQHQTFDTEHALEFSKIRFTYHTYNHDGLAQLSTIPAIYFDSIRETCA